MQNKESQSAVAVGDSQLNELIAGLKKKRQEVSIVIDEKQQEVEGLSGDISILTQRLNDLSANIQRKKEMSMNYAESIDKATKGLNRIQDSTQLLHSYILDRMKNSNQPDL